MKILYDMKVNKLEAYVLTIILIVAVSNECTSGQARKNRNQGQQMTKMTKVFSDKRNIGIKRKEGEAQIKKHSRSEGTRRHSRAQKKEQMEEIVSRLLAHDRLQTNQRWAKGIVPANKFPKIFPGLDTPQTYADFIQAIGKFPQVCRNWRDCGKELMALGAFADQARCAGEPSHFISNLLLRHFKTFFPKVVMSMR